MISTQDKNNDEYKILLRARNTLIIKFQRILRLSMAINIWKNIYHNVMKLLKNLEICSLTYFNFNRFCCSFFQICSKSLQNGIHSEKNSLVGQLSSGPVFGLKEKKHIVFINLFFMSCMEVLSLFIVSFAF